MTDPEHVAFLAQAIGVVGMLVAFAIMLRLRAKELREKAKREAEKRLTPPEAREPDRPDWHGAPAGKPR